MNSGRSVKPDPRRSLPAVDRVVEALGLGRPELPVWAAREGARTALAAARARISAGGQVSPAPTLAELVAAAGQTAAELSRPHPGPVLNATGVLSGNPPATSWPAIDPIRAVAIMITFVPGSFAT